MNYISITRWFAFLFLLSMIPIGGAFSEETLPPPEPSGQTVEEPTPAPPQPKPEEKAKPDWGKFSGLMFGDYYWFAKHNTAKNQNGFWFRRIYFTYDKDITEAFSSRFRLEMKSKDFATTPAEVITPFIKDAYLRWKPNLHALYFGISPSPTWELIEPHWGYRSIEKTPLDLWKFGGSRDFGIAARGEMVKDKVGYHIMLGNGADTKHEIDQEKKVFFSSWVKPIKTIVIEGYGDLDLKKGERSWVLQGFAGFKNDYSRFGGQYAHRNGSGDLLSFYGAAKVVRWCWVFARTDRVFDPVTSDIDYIHQDTTGEPWLFLGGFDFEVAPKIHVMPNVEAITYRGAGNAKTDVIVKTTFFWEF